MPETWKPVTGYEGLYEVSDLGRVRSLGRPYRMRNSQKRDVIMDCRKPARILKTGGRKYAQVGLYDSSGKKRLWAVHRLVAEAFLGPHPGLEINHINGDPTDHRLTNLEWITHAENIIHSRRVLGKCCGETWHKSKLTEARVMELRRAYASGEPITPFAREFGVSVTAACNAAKGKTWQTVPMP